MRKRGQNSAKRVLHLGKFFKLYVSVHTKVLSGKKIRVPFGGRNWKSEGQIYSVVV